MAPNTTSDRISILMIGPLPPPIGGVSVSLKQLVDLLKQRDDVDIAVVNISEIRQKKRKTLRGFLPLTKTIISATRRADVISVYLASPALPKLGLMLLVISKVFAKPLIVRKAANFDYLDLGSFWGRIAHFVVKRCDLFLAETKNLVRLVGDRGGSHVEWYPTSRPMSYIDRSDTLRDKSCRRFVFVGQVREYKGILEIIQAAERFDDDVRVDIYGPLFDDIGAGVFEDCRRVRYCGVLSPDNVISTLKQYDVLLLPTKALTEGYPGAVLESYAAGLPIITTRCGGIPEIVDESSGVFAEPGDSDSLFEAMKTLVENDEVYRNIKKGGLIKRTVFDSLVWAERFVNYCEELVASRRQRREL